MQQNTPEWHAARKGRVTASMVGAILGVAPYMTRADAMRRMVRDYHWCRTRVHRQRGYRLGNAKRRWRTV